MLRNRCVVAHFQQFVVGYQKQCVVQHCCSAFSSVESDCGEKRTVTKAYSLFLPRVGTLPS